MHFHNKHKRILSNIQNACGDISNHLGPKANAARPFHPVEDWEVDDGILFGWVAPPPLIEVELDLERL